MANAPKKLRTSVKSRYPLPPSPRATSKLVSIADAKANLSSFIHSVETRRNPITITRRGVPVAQLVPLTKQEITSGYGWMRGTMQELGDIIAPAGVEWIARDEHGAPFGEDE